MTQEQFNVLDPKVASHREELLRTQQGDFNAVLMYDGYVITDQKTTNSENTIIMLLCSCRKMYTFAAKIAQTRFNEHEFRIYIAPFPAYLLAILSMAISEWRESAGHCRCAIQLTSGLPAPDA